MRDEMLEGARKIANGKRWTKRCRGSTDERFRSTALVNDIFKLYQAKRQATTSRPRCVTVASIIIPFIIRCAHSGFQGSGLQYAPFNWYVERSKCNAIHPVVYWGTLILATKTTTD